MSYSWTNTVCGILDWLVSISNMHLSFLHVFSRLDNSFFCVCWVVFHCQNGPRIIYLLTNLRVCVPSRLSRIRLFETLWTVALQAPLSMGSFRQEYWNRLPYPPPRDLPNPGIEPVSPEAPALQADSLLRSHQGSPHHQLTTHYLSTHLHYLSTHQGHLGCF